MKCDVCEGRGLVAGTPEVVGYDEATGDVTCPSCEGSGLQNLREYRIDVTITRNSKPEPVPLLGLGASLFAPSFEVAFPLLLEELSERLDKASPLVPLAEIDPESPDVPS